MYKSDEPPASFASRASRRLVLLLEGLILSAGTGFLGTILFLELSAGPLRGADGIAAGAWILVAAVVAMISAPVGLILTWVVTSESSERGFDRWQCLMGLVGLFLGVAITQFVFARYEIAARVIIGSVVVPLCIKVTRFVAPLGIRKLIQRLSTWN